MENLVGQGFELAVFGMGTVFVFLALLIFATQAMSALVLRFQPEVTESSVAAVTQGKSVASGHMLAVISAAIAQHRKRSK